jgi:hypothetical protein
LKIKKADIQGLLQFAVREINESVDLRMSTAKRVVAARLQTLAIFLTVLGLLIVVVATVLIRLFKKTII